MVRAVTEKDQKKALDLYYDLLTLKEPPMRILFLLARQYRQLLLAKKMTSEGASQNEISSRLGIPVFAVRNIVSCARSYETEELEKAVEDFVDAEEAVKTVSSLFQTLCPEVYSASGKISYNIPVR